ncbi:hypothetical protein IJT17_09115 [bacterium]|nr:hypothetical protein [bacterium]
MALAYITYCGTLCARHTLRFEDKYLALAAGLPLGLSLFTLITAALQTFFTLPVSAIISLIALRLADLPQSIQRFRDGDAPDAIPPEQPEPFSHITAISLAILALLFAAVIHLFQVSTLPADFLSAYPFARAMLKGPLDLSVPFFTSQTYPGSLHRAILSASLSLPLSGDVLRAEWIANTVLLLCGFWLWALAMRLFLRRALPAALGTVLLFALLTPACAPYNSELEIGRLLDINISGALLAIYISLIRQCKNHWQVPPLACALAGAISFFALAVCPIPFLVMFGIFVTLAVYYSFQRRFLIAILMRCVLLIGAAIALWGITQRAYWQQLTQLHEMGLGVFRFPVRSFLSIAIPPLGDTPFYASLFSLSSLRYHAISIWFAPLLLPWAIWRKSNKGFTLWCGGAILFLLPGFIDFQHSYGAAPWLWEYTADAMFAVLLGYALGDIYQLWARDRSKLMACAQRLALAGAIALAMLPSVYSVWQTERSFPEIPQRGQYLYSPIYPPTMQWLGRVHGLALNAEETELASWLWDNLADSPRTVFALPAPEQNTAEHLALLAGSAGCLPAGSYSNIALEKEPNRKYQPAPGVLVFMQKKRPDALLSAGAELAVSSAGIPEVSGDLCEFRLWHKTEAAASGAEALAVYKIKGAVPWDRPTVTYPTPDKAITISGLPNASHAAGGVVYMVSAKLNSRLRGWLCPVWSDSGSSQTGKNCQLYTYIDGDRAEIPFVFPYREGSYSVSWVFYPQNGTEGADGPAPSAWRLAGATPAEQQLSSILDNSLRLVSIDSTSPHQGTVTLTNIAQEPLEVGADLCLSWQIWSSKTHTYVYSNSADTATLTLPLSPGAAVKIPWHTAYPIGPQDRIEFSAGAPYGRHYSVTRK